MPANLAIYLPGPAPTAESIRSHPSVETADIDEGPDGTPTQYRLVVNKVGVRITPMEAAKISGHIGGFLQFAATVPPTQHTEDVKKKLRAVRNVLGCVIEPDVDAEGEVDDFLYEIASKGDGIVFMADSVFSAEGVGLVGRCVGLNRREVR